MCIFLSSGYIEEMSCEIVFVHPSLGPCGSSPITMAKTTTTTGDTIPLATNTLATTTLPSTTQSTTDESSDSTSNTSPTSLVVGTVFGAGLLLLALLLVILGILLVLRSMKREKNSGSNTNMISFFTQRVKNLSWKGRYVTSERSLHTKPTNIDSNPAYASSSVEAPVADEIYSYVPNDGEQMNSLARSIPITTSCNEAYSSMTIEDTKSLRAGEKRDVSYIPNEQMSSLTRTIPILTSSNEAYSSTTVEDTKSLRAGEERDVSYTPNDGEQMNSLTKPIPTSCNEAYSSLIREGTKSLRAGEEQDVSYTPNDGEQMNSLTKPIPTSCNEAYSSLIREGTKSLRAGEEQEQIEHDYVVHSLVHGTTTETPKTDNLCFDGDYELTVDEKRDCSEPDTDELTINEAYEVVDHTSTTPPRGVNTL